MNVKRRIVLTDEDDFEAQRKLQAQAAADKRAALLAQRAEKALKLWARAKTRLKRAKTLERKYRKQVAYYQSKGVSRAL